MKAKRVYEHHNFTRSNDIKSNLNLGSLIKLNNMDKDALYNMVLELLLDNGIEIFDGEIKDDDLNCKTLCYDIAYNGNSKEWIDVKWNLCTGQLELRKYGSSGGLLAMYPGKTFIKYAKSLDQFLSSVIEYIK